MPRRRSPSPTSCSACSCCRRACTKTKRRPFDLRRANPFGAMLSLRKYPVVLWLLLALFLFTMAAQAFPVGLQLLHDRGLQLHLVADRPHARRCSASSSRCSRRSASGRWSSASGRRRWWSSACWRRRSRSPASPSSTTQLLALCLPRHRRAQRPCGARDQRRAVAAGARQCAGRTAGRGQRRQLAGDHHRPARGDADLRLFHLRRGSPGYFPGAPFLAAGIVIVGRWSLFLFVVAALRPQPQAERRRAPAVPEMAPPGQIHIPDARGRRRRRANGNGNGHPPRN